MLGIGSCNRAREMHVQVSLCRLEEGHGEGGDGEDRRGRKGEGSKLRKKRTLYARPLGELVLPHFRDRTGHLSKAVDLYRAQMDLPQHVSGTGDS